MKIFCSFKHIISKSYIQYLCRLYGVNMFHLNEKNYTEKQFYNIGDNNYNTYVPLISLCHVAFYVFKMTSIHFGLIARVRKFHF